MHAELLRFKKSGFSGGQSSCVEVAHTLQCLRDSKNPDGAVLQGGVRALIDMARAEPLRFKKSRFSGGQSDCVEVAHTLQCLRDSKNPNGVLLHGDVRTLIEMTKVGEFSR